jgi:hypothetical protein
LGPGFGLAKEWECKTEGQEDEGGAAHARECSASGGREETEQ